MRHIATTTPSGPVQFHYVISTPTNSNATDIDRSLPTIIFLHHIYVNALIFHPQFANREMRRVNLIAVESRLHGKTIGKVPSHYRREEAGEDVYYFMKALSLPPCHIVGTSMGACIGQALAILYPESVLSLTMISPLPLQESPDVIEGKEEINKYWVAGLTGPGGPDMVALMDAVCGALQLGFNGEVDQPYVKALTAVTMPDHMANWSLERLDEVFVVNVEFFRAIKPHAREQLQRISCPVHIVHCEEDVAYPVEFAEEVFQSLHDAGVDARVSSLAGAPHFGTLTHHQEASKLILDFVLQHTKTPVPPAEGEVESPWEKDFAREGWAKLGHEDSDDEVTFV